MADAILTGYTHWLPATLQQFAGRPGTLIEEQSDEVCCAVEWDGRVYIVPRNHLRLSSANGNGNANGDGNGDGETEQLKTAGYIPEKWRSEGRVPEEGEGEGEQGVQQ